MKLLKSLSLGLIAVATAGTASAAAPTIIHVAGSTAFRTGASIAIIDTLNGSFAGGGSGSTAVFGAYSDTSIAGAKQQIFANGYIGSVDPNPGNDVAATIIIEATWTGSLAGVVDVVAGTSTAAFIDETNATVIAAVNNQTTGQIAAGTTYLGGTNLNSTTLTHSTNQTVELAQSDSFKQTISKELATGTLSGTLGSYSSISALATACGGSTVVPAGTSSYAAGQDAVAIVPFEWVLGSNSGTGYVAPTNMTQQVARQLIGAGYVPQALFTGTSNAADSANYFYLEGRNEDSGTRIGALSESQFGVTLAPTQYKVGDDASTLSPTLVYPVTALNTEPSISWTAAGHSGYSSGGNVAAPLELANNGSITFTNGKAGPNTGGSYFIGYLGLTDAASAVNAKNSTATVLNYNGVPYSPAAVQNGSYSFWTYEHSYRLSTLSGTQLTVVNEIADNLYYNDADAIYSTSTGLTHADNNGVYSTGSAGLFLYDVNVSRGFEGSRSLTKDIKVVRAHQASAPSSRRI